MKKLVFTAIILTFVFQLFAGNTALSSYLLVDSFPEVAAVGPDSGVASYGVNYSDINPAAATGVDNFAFSAMHSVMPLNISLEKISVVKHFDFGNIGANISYVDFGAYSGIGVDENLYPVLTGHIENPFSLYGSVIYAKNFDNYSLGATLKLINENLAGVSNFSGAVDLGVIMETIFNEDMNLGISLCNISTKDNDFALPLDIKAGLSYKIKNKTLDLVKLTVSADYLLYEQALLAGVGFDYTVFDELVLRGGFTFGNKQELKFSAGFGMNIGETNFSYAFVPDSIAGNTHKFSISGTFGKEKTEVTNAKSGESFGGYMKSGNYYYENKQYRLAVRYYEYVNLLYWKEIEDMKDNEKSSFFQKLGICYYNMRDNKNAKQYFERAVYFERDNEILKHWIKLLN